MRSTISNVRVGIMAGFVLAAMAPAAWAAGNVYGIARYEKIKGRPQLGYIELYETNLFFSPPNNSAIGPSRRLGTYLYNGSTCVNTTNGGGCYCISGMAAGSYSMLLNQPLFFIAPKVVTNVSLTDGQWLIVNPELPIEYSTYFRDGGQWTDAATVWYQTFTTSPTCVGVRGISFNVAGSPSRSVEVALLEDNGLSDVRNWRLITSRIEPAVVQDGDNWVRFRSQDAPVTAGKKYAVRLTALSPGATIQPYKRNKDGYSYVGGQAYNAQGQPQNYDLNVTVFGDNDGTIVTMNRRTKGLGWLCDNFYWGQRWGQTFIAHGAGLAAADVFAAGANSDWNLTFGWKVREGGPTGAQIGPTKTTQAAFQGAGAGLHGVSFNPGEVPLVPGQTYFVEFYIVNPPADSNGFNPYVMSPQSDSPCGGGDNVDSFDEGIAYRDNEARPNVDLSMTIIEYSIPPKMIQAIPQTFSRTVFVGDALPPDTLNIRNVGTGTLDYTLTDNAGWLSVSPASGSSTGETDPIAVSYNMAGLGIGTYNAAITISASGATNTPVLVPFTVNVVSVGPDFNGDLDVDQEDFGHLQECFTGPGILNTNSACTNADLDKDGDIDQDDCARLIACVSGPNNPANRNCEPN